MLDILSIDTRIKAEFMREFERVPEYQEQISEYTATLSAPEQLSVGGTKLLRDAIRSLKKKVSDLKSRQQYYFYLSDSSGVIDEYRTILRTPIRVSVRGGRKPKADPAKLEVISRYLNIAKAYTDIVVSPPTKSSVVCPCGNRRDFEIIDKSIYICLQCGVEKKVKPHTSAFKDIDRINIASRYFYDRAIHFSDCIKQYSARQNCTIDTCVYEGLTKQFFLHGLLVGKEGTPKKKRFSRITKLHIHMFLKDLGYTKHYENINLIHYNMTGVKPDDISHLEDRLMEDFAVLVDYYDKTYGSDPMFTRSNFINTQNILYQFLTRYKHPCSKADFTILKTIDRKSFHDTITSKCFAALGWNHQCLY